MMPDSPSLESLPVEILCSILRLLDPIGLISTSQISSKFRAVIQPKRIHLLERLLELECREEFGGVTPILRGRDNNIKPETTSEQWDSMRWACSMCLEMLPHKAFNNHYLLRLQYRKPIPGSPAVVSYTSWEPTRDRKLHNLYNFQGRPRMSKNDDRKIRHRYNLSCKGNRIPSQTPRDMRARLIQFQDSGMITFQGYTLDEYLCITQEEEQALLDYEARLIERERCGSMRHLRKCNECCFQRGEISCAITRFGESMHRGTAKVPIVVSRRLPFATALDRCFPGISAIMESVRPASSAPVQRIYRENVFDCLWTMYMVRCSKCSRWQELRAFRLGPTFPHWAPVSTSDGDPAQNWDGTEITPTLIDGSSCNSCFAKEHGREKLSDILMTWLERTLNGERQTLGYLLMGGWERLSRRSRHLKALSDNIEIAKLVASIQPFVELCEKSHNYRNLHLTDLRTLKLHFREWLVVKNNLSSKELDKLGINPWDRLWENNYEVIESQLIWVHNCQKELQKGKGDSLVDWALNRDGSAMT